MAPVSKWLLAGGLISGTALADIRLITGTILFWLVSLFIKKEKIDRGDYLRLIGAAFFSSTLTQILFVNGVARTSPVDASICTSSLPIWTMLLPLSSMTLDAVDWSCLSMSDWAALAYILLFGTFLSYLIVPIGQKTLKPTVVAMYNYLQPVSSATFCMLSGVEGFSLVKLVALILIFAGVTIVSKS